MAAWLLAKAIPWRLVAYVVAAVAIAMYAGVDVLGMIDTAIVAPIIDWVTQEVIDQFAFW